MTSIPLYHSLSLRLSVNSTLHHENAVVSSSSKTRQPFPFSFPRSHAFAVKSTPTLFPNQSKSLLLSANNKIVNPITASSSSSSPCHTFDVVIIGAGIIGLTIARQFLLGSDLSVAVVDKALPCSGATGAGQGYIWMVHKTPGTDTWDLTLRSHKLWKMLADSISDQGLNPLQELGWKRTGSLLIGRNPEELAILKDRVKQLSEAGLRAEYLPGDELLREEPELMVGEHTGAAFLPDDCQLDAMRTVAYIEKVNRQFAAKGRYAEFYHDPVASLFSTGAVEAVQTSKNTLYCKKAVVVAAGCWSGSLMHDLLRETDIVLDIPVKPRKVGIKDLN